MGNEPSDLSGGNIYCAPHFHHCPLTLTTPPPTVIFVNFKPFTTQPCRVLLYASFVHSARTGHTRSLSSSQHTLSCSLTKLPSQIVMSVQGSGRDLFRICICCNRSLSRLTRRHHRERCRKMQLESRSPPPKWCRIAHFQVGQESSNSCTSCFCAGGSSSSSDHPQISTPQLHTPSFKFNPSLPLLDPPVASNLLQLPEDAVGAADSVCHGTHDFWGEGDIAMEGDVDPHEGIVSSWDLLAKEFIVEAEELGKFEHPLLHTP